MKQIKFWAIALLAFMMPLIMVTPAWSSSANTAVFTVGSPVFILNGKLVTMDVSPCIINGVTLLPVRYAANSIGIDENNIQWNADDQTVTISQGNNEIQFGIDVPAALVNNKMVTLDVPAQFINGRMLVPLKYVTETFGVQTTWNQSARTITLVSGQNDAVSAPTTGVQPFGSTDLQANGIKLGMSLSQVEDAVGKSFYILGDTEEEAKDKDNVPSNSILNYSWGCVTLVDGKVDSIDINQTGYRGPRDIKVDDQASSVINKFAGKLPAQSASTQSLYKYSNNNAQAYVDFSGDNVYRLRYMFDGPVGSDSTPQYWLTIYFNNNKVTDFCLEVH